MAAPAWAEYTESGGAGGHGHLLRAHLQVGHGWEDICRWVTGERAGGWAIGWGLVCLLDWLLGWAGLGGWVGGWVVGWLGVGWLIG